MLAKGAIVTGGAKRLGKEIALFLADKGYDIAIHCNQSLKEAHLVQKQIEAKGRRCVVIQADLQQEQAIQYIIDTAYNHIPHLNVLIHNAALFPRCSFLESTSVLYDEVMAVNLRAPFLLTQAFVKQCKAGHIITLLDSYSTKAHSPYFVYLLSKKGLAELTRMMARSLAPSFRVNGLYLGIVDLPEGIPMAVEEAFLEKKKAQLPVPGLVSIQEVLEGMDYLLHGSSQTGNLIFVDHGENLI